MELEIGKTYLITASRKGTFMMRITSQCDTWTGGVVVGGQTQAMMEHNKCYKGDKITCRTSFITGAVKQLEAA